MNKQPKPQSTERYRRSEFYMSDTIHIIDVDYRWSVLITGLAYEGERWIGKPIKDEEADK
jgi:hypothetical protein